MVQYLWAGESDIYKYWRSYIFPCFPVESPVFEKEKPVIKNR